MEPLSCAELPIPMTGLTAADNWRSNGRVLGEEFSAHGYIDVAWDLRFRHRRRWIVGRVGQDSM